MLCFYFSYGYTMLFLWQFDFSFLILCCITTYWDRFLKCVINELPYTRVRFKHRNTHSEPPQPCCAYSSLTARKANVPWSAEMCCFLLGACHYVKYDTSMKIAASRGSCTVYNWFCQVIHYPSRLIPCQCQYPWYSFFIISTVEFPSQGSGI